MRYGLKTLLGVFLLIGVLLGLLRYSMRENDNYGEVLVRPTNLSLQFWWSRNWEVLKPVGWQLLQDGVRIESGCLEMLQPDQEVLEYDYYLGYLANVDAICIYREVSASVTETFMVYYLHNGKRLERPTDRELIHAGINMTSRADVTRSLKLEVKPYRTAPQTFEIR